MNSKKNKFRQSTALFIADWNIGSGAGLTLSRPRLDLNQDKVPALALFDNRSSGERGSVRDARNLVSSESSITTAAKHFTIGS